MSAPPLALPALSLALPTLSLALSLSVTSIAFAAPSTASKLGVDLTRRWRKRANTRFLATKLADLKLPKRAAGLLLLLGKKRLETKIYSLGKSGFAHSSGLFWPASTIKLAAALGALERLRALGVDGNATIELKDSYGRYRGRFAWLYQRAISQSTNRDYDRLVRIAGLDFLNQRFFRRLGLRHTVLQCPYGGASTLGNSPELRFRLGKKRRQRAAFVSSTSRPDCPAPKTARA
jgi:hypothetical protein